MFPMPLRNCGRRAVSRRETARCDSGVDIRIILAAMGRRERSEEVSFFGRRGTARAARRARGGAQEEAETCRIVLPGTRPSAGMEIVGVRIFYICKAVLLCCKSIAFNKLEVFLMRQRFFVHADGFFGVNKFYSLLQARDGSTWNRLKNNGIKIWRRFCKKM